MIRDSGSNIIISNNHRHHNTNSSNPGVKVINNLDNNRVFANSNNSSNIGRTNPSSETRNHNGDHNHRVK
jgi:hypothetical protein